MRHVRRFYMGGGCYFFTVVTYHRQALLCREQAIDRLRKAFRYTAKKHPFSLQAIVILPDHLHCLWQLPANDADFSIRWNMIKRYFSIGVQASVNRRREKTIWQARFWDHFIRNEDDWQRHLDYIHYNPVKHGYADKPINWLYSSFKSYVAKGFYNVDWGSNEPDLIKDMDYE